MQRRVSSLPGRLRVRDLAWRQADSLERHRHAVLEVPGVRQVVGNPRTGSLLVHYDPAGTDFARVQSLLGLAAVAPVPVTAPGRPQRNPGRVSSARLNRAAKLVMLGSLGLSMGLVAVGAKKGHALAGAAFVLALVMHLTVHRERLFR